MCKSTRRAISRSQAPGLCSRKPSAYKPALADIPNCSSRIIGTPPQEHRRHEMSDCRDSLPNCRPTSSWARFMGIVGAREAHYFSAALLDSSLTHSLTPKPDELGIAPNLRLQQHTSHRSRAPTRGSAIAGRDGRPSLPWRGVHPWSRLPRGSTPRSSPNAPSALRIGNQPVLTTCCSNM